MKKIIYTILGIFLMAACTDDHIEDISIPTNGEIGGTAKIRFSVQVPEAKAAGSRSFTDPAITTLQVAVFDANGYLVEAPEAVRAEGETGLGIAADPIEFEVTLSQTPSKRILHFLGNKSIDPNQFGSEGDLITALYSESNADAYWQRVELPDGINVGEAWNDADNDGVKDDGETVQVNTIGDKLTKVPLIRNFAKITVTTKEGGVTTTNDATFELQGFTVVNVPDRGSVAPFNVNGGGFAQYLDSNKTPYSYTTLTTTTATFNGYTGFVPNDMEINEEVPAASAFLEAGKEFYLYERNGQSKNTNRTFVIVKGKFGNDEPSYYKIDLTYTDPTNQTTKYYEILRNFHYNIVINTVEASGAKSPQDAADMTGAHNNLSAAIETQSLLNISDGESRLFVSHTEYVFVTGTTYKDDGTTIDVPSTMELKYRYVPDIDNPNTVNNENVTYSLENKDNAADNAVLSITPADADVNGWRTLTVTAAQMGEGAKRQTLTLVAGNLSRTVTFILRPKFDFYDEMATSPQTVSGASSKLKATFVYSFTIPSESNGQPNIPESLFPLTFIVQGTPESIYPNADENSLPVHVLDGEQTFGYERVVTWEEYQQTGGIINCYFRVNTTAYSGTKLTVSNPYFNTSDEVELNDNNSTYAFSNLTVNDGEAVPYGVGKSVTFTFDMPYVDTTNGTKVTITANKMSDMSRATTFTYTATQAGTQEVTFTTGEFASADRIKLEASNYITGIKAYENKLQIKASTINLVTGTTATALRVYGSESAAKDYKNYLAEQTTSNLTSTFTDVALTGLTAESLVWFAYQSGDYIYVASARAGELADGTATITFNADNKVDVPLDMSVVFSDEARYYGTTQTFILTFTTNKSGKYKVEEANFDFYDETSNTTSTALVEFDATAGVPISVTCKPTTWRDPAYIRIDYISDSEGKAVTEEPMDWTGPDRTIIKSSKTITVQGLNYAQDTATITVYKTMTTSSSWGQTSYTFSDEVCTITLEN